jgi:hypothetical protein
MPGRERCGPEQVVAERVPELVRFTCVESCAKSAMESYGVIAPASHPAEKKRAALSQIQERLLACFAGCNERSVALAAANMASGVEPCTESASLLHETQCLTYSCQYYGDQQYMLPIAQHEGQSCNIPSTNEPGTCLAGSCVPANAHTEACAASSIHDVVRQWKRTLDAQRECTRPGATVACYPRPLGLSSRTLLLGLLDCERLQKEQNAPLSPLAPWGHWPVSLTRPEAK